MNGEIPSVPITTLAGVTSLTDLLPELPLPTPLPHNTNNRSLLYHHGLPEDAKRMLHSSDPNVVLQLVAVLQNTNTDNILLNDGLGTDNLDVETPELMRAILSLDPAVFNRSTPMQNHNADSTVPNHNEHPSPHQAGPSPCTPDSPARVPQNNLHGFQHGSSSGFQASFLNFASQNHLNHVTSPTQASAAPNSRIHENGAIGKSRENSVVVMEPIHMNAILNPPISNDASHKQKKQKENETPSSYVVSQPESSGKLTLKITKPKPDKKGSKRRRSEEENSMSNHDSVNLDDIVITSAEFAPSLGERVKRRRTKVQYTEGSDDDVIEIGDEVVMGSKKQRKRRDVDEEFVPAGLDTQQSSNKAKIEPSSASNQSQSNDQSHSSMPKLKGPVIMLRDCMDYTSTQRKFLALCEGVVESTEDMDMVELAAEDDDDAGGSTAIVRQDTLVELCCEAAKLKSGGLMNLIPYGKLVKVLTILQYNIRDGCRALPSIAEDGGHDEELLREIALEKVISAMDASLVALYIMTSKNMPKEVYLEDVIERLVRMTKIQLQHTIYPEFDPVYRVDPKNKTGYTGNIKAKRARSGAVKNRTILQLYNKLTEVISLLAELVEIQTFTDTIILQTSSLTVSPFFVENISELQLNSLNLVTNIFTRYEKHRQLIMEDILASLARLPTSKKNLRSYRLKNSDDHIQMVTALVLQLIQCVVKIPSSIETSSESDAAKPAENMDSEVIIVTSYENTMRTAHNFLAVFLKKCTTKGDEDYRPLFENFVYDLLATVNKPEWPAAELLLSLLGRLLVAQFSNKSVDMALRVASLDYLGIVAARLRKDAVSSQLNENIIDTIISQIKGEKVDPDVQALDDTKPEVANEDKTEEDKEEERQEKEVEEDENTKEEKEDVKKSKSKKIKKKKGRRRGSRRLSSEESEEEEEETKPESTKSVDDSRTQSLQNSLLEYLVYNAQQDQSLFFARQFYIGQWYRDCGLDVERATRQLKKLQSSRNQDPDEVAKELDKTKEIQLIAESRKSFLLAQVNTKVGAFASFKPSPSRLDYDKCCLVTRYLASSRPFSQSFEVYLTQILKVLCETAVAVRTRSMKCLSLVVEADPGILARADMQRGVHGRLLDHSTSVREAAVELVGKFLVSRPELINQYYDMLSDRILDTGISVRKRVIKIFRDICVEQADFEKIPEMCVKMIRRVNDEEGIKKLVNETFQTMWFTPVSDSLESRTARLRTRVMNITDVVNACKETGYEWFEHLLENLLKKEEESKDKPVEKACAQLIDCLIERVLKLEAIADCANGGTCSARLIACVSTLHLFCKVKPQLLVRHTQVLQPYLDIKCGAAGDFMVIHNVAKMLELAVPLMEHPSENFLAQLEEDMMKLIFKHGMMVLQSCVSCLGAIVNTVTHNYKLVRDCFEKFFGVLSRFMQQHQQDPRHPQLRASLPTMLRSLYTLGLLCRYFDFDSEDFGERKGSVKERVFDVLYYFISHEDEQVRHKALSGIGFFATRHYEFMLGKTLRDLYTHTLTDDEVSVKMRIQVLSNLNHYLIEEEFRMMKAEDEWKKLNKAEDLKEMGDVQSGMASTIIQIYLKHLLESFFHSDSAVRMAALNVIVLVLKQGLVHPVHIVPYLIAMGADCDNLIRIKSDQQVAEIDKKYPGFIQMKAVQGVKMAFRLQEIMQQAAERAGEPIRGVRVEDGHPVALCSYIYSLIRSNRNMRRGLLTSMLNLFDDTAKTPINELIFMADNLAAFPYQCQDEPLFIIHQVDIRVSVSGSNVLQSYREIFFPEALDETGRTKEEIDDMEEDMDTLISKLPDDVTQLNELYMLTQGCLLLLMLKQHMKEVFGFTEVKLQRYSPSDQAKVWDKSLTRKHGYEFDPKPVIELVSRLPLPNELDAEGRRNLMQDYIDFKGLMMSIDPNEEDDDEEGGAPRAAGATSGAAQRAATAGAEGAGDAGAAGGAEAAGEEKGAGDATVRADNPEVIDLDDSGDKDELQAKTRETPLTSSKASYNKLLTLVTSSSSKKNKDSSHHHHGGSSRSKSSSRRSHASSRGGGGGDSHAHNSHSSKSHKKKKKKKRSYSDSDLSDSDNMSSDPDWA